MTLYNGGSKKVVTVHANGEVFHGLFASPSKTSAMAHGEVISTFEIPDEKILNSYDFEKNDEYYEKGVEIIKDYLEIDEDHESFDDIINSILFDDFEDGAFDDENFSWAKSDYDTDGSWLAQRLRGIVADRLGFLAIEMNDEHGTSYNIVPGVESCK